MSETVYILLGTNLGDREKNLAVARKHLDTFPGLELTAASGIYITEPQDMPEGVPQFLNQVLRGDFQFLPSELLDGLESIEMNMGRTDKGTLEPRIIDLDILLFGDRVITTDRLTIPHVRLLSRPFAMVPLLEINPDVIHPGVNKPVADFLRDEDKNNIILFKDHVARSI